MVYRQADSANLTRRLPVKSHRNLRVGVPQSEENYASVLIKTRPFLSAERASLGNFAVKQCSWRRPRLAPAAHTRTFIFIGFTYEQAAFHGVTELQQDWQQQSAAVLNFAGYD